MFFFEVIYFVPDADVVVRLVMDKFPDFETTFIFRGCLLPDCLIELDMHV